MFLETILASPELTIVKVTTSPEATSMASLAGEGLLSYPSSST